MIRLNERSQTPLSQKNNKVLRGTFAELDTWNQNERMYPKDVYEESLEEVQDKISSGQFLGELDHPEYDEVRLQNVSHVVRECNIQGNKVVGEIEILDTPAGKIVQTLMEAGIPIGVSSRAFGDVKESQGGDVVTDLQLITYDIVADPSFASAVLTESKKLKMNKRLDEIKRSLPLRESKSSKEICKKINSIKDTYSLERETDPLQEMVAKLGEQTIQERKSKETNKDLIIRNNSLREKMHQLQEGYNELADQLELVIENYQHAQEDLYRLQEDRRDRDITLRQYDHDIDKLESDLDHLSRDYQRLAESSQAEILDLKKELAVEKRGLNKNRILPLLEGASNDREIERRLNSINTLGNKRSAGYSNKAMKSLTEGNKNSTSEGIQNLAKLISRV